MTKLIQMISQINPILDASLKLDVKKNLFNNLNKIKRELRSRRRA